MEQTNYIPVCSACGTPMVLREKDGSKFWGCPNYRQCGGKTKPFGSKTPQQPTKPEPENGNYIIMDELQAFRKEVNERLDALAVYLSKNLPKNNDIPQK